MSRTVATFARGLEAVSHSPFGVDVGPSVAVDGAAHAAHVRVERARGGEDPAICTNPEWVMDILEFKNEKNVRNFNKTWAKRFINWRSEKNREGKE